jgi:hypothetical protein
MKKEVLEKRKRILGEDHPSTISAMNNLANTLGGQGQPEEALDLLKVTVRQMNLILGHEHHYTETASGNLARLRNRIASVSKPHD